MRHKYRIAALLAATVLVAVSASTAVAGGNEKTLEFENQLQNSVERNAQGRVRVFEDTARGFLTLETDVQRLFCRSGGTDSFADPFSDDLGSAMFSIAITTENVPRTRLHLFNTDCWQQRYSGVYYMNRYLDETGQTVDDILNEAITIEVLLHRDENSDFHFEQEFVVLKATG